MTLSLPYCRRCDLLVNNGVRGSANGDRQKYKHKTAGKDSFKTNLCLVGCHTIARWRRPHGTRRELIEPIFDSRGWRDLTLNIQTFM